MTDRFWPTDILPPAVLRPGFQYARKQATESTEWESGQARDRRTELNPNAVVPVRWVMNEEQFGFFKAWLEHVAQYSAAWFSIALPLEGNAYRTVQAKFTGNRPTSVPHGAAKMLVSAELEVRDTNVVTADVVDIVLAYGLNGVPAMEDAIDDLTLQPFFDTMDDFAGA